MAWRARATAGDGFYWATTDRYEIHFYGGDGALRRILRRPVEPRPVTEAMITEYIDAQLDVVRRYEGEAAVARYERQYREEATYGETVPLFGTAFVDGDGRLWISESTWPGQGSPPSPPRRWSVFSLDGAWLGDLDAPDGLTITDARGDVVVGIRRDALDVPYVQLHRLAGAERDP